MNDRRVSMGDKVYRGDVVKYIRNNISLDTFMKRSVAKADQACWDLCDKLNFVPAISEWIPVTERLPDEDLQTGWGKQFSNNVLMTVYDKNDEDTIVDYGHTVDGEWYSETADEYIESIADWKVTAWMPMTSAHTERSE